MIIITFYYYNYFEVLLSELKKCCNKSHFYSIKEIYTEVNYLLKYIVDSFVLYKINDYLTFIYFLFNILQKKKNIFVN